MASASLRQPPQLPPFLRRPWPGQVLLPDALARGLGPLGSGSQMAALARKLLSGQRITAVVLGGSVTYGAGATNLSASFPGRLEAWLRYAFPASAATVLNRGIPASTSGLSAMCSERLVPADTDLVVVEFTLVGAGGGQEMRRRRPHAASLGEPRRARQGDCTSCGPGRPAAAPPVPVPVQNDPVGHALGSPERLAPEVLLRKLLAMRSRPAVALLHYYRCGCGWVCVCVCGGGGGAGRGALGPGSPLPAAARRCRPPPPAARPRHLGAAPGVEPGMLQGPGEPTAPVPHPSSPRLLCPAGTLPAATGARLASTLRPPPRRTWRPWPPTTICPRSACARQSGR